MIALGLVEDKPYRIFGAQATGCAPVARAWEKGYTVVQPVKPDTIAKSLAIGNPADGPYVLDVCRTGGAVEHATRRSWIDPLLAHGGSSPRLRAGHHWCAANCWPRSAGPRGRDRGAQHRGRLEGSRCVRYRCHRDDRRR